MQRVNSCPPLSLIESYYGTPWSWRDRHAVAETLSDFSFSSYLYAPKNDATLRKGWRLPMPTAHTAELRAFSERCKGLGLSFGIGLSPYELYREEPCEARRQLTQRVKELASQVPLDRIGLFFDDMRGDLPELATRQINLAEAVREAFPSGRLMVCPTYYCADKKLENRFGTMPPGYWETLGTGLPGDVELFWTGPHVRSPEVSCEHLRWVREQFGRKIFFWDNYPVNDGRKFSDFLLLRPFPARSAELAEEVTGYGVNPMMQPYLSLLPISTLPASFTQGDAYNPAVEFSSSLRKICGKLLASFVEEDIARFQELGLQGLSSADRQELRDRYKGVPACPMADEILRWLDGEYRFDPIQYE
jgi:hyaluronoglucosaminidase